MKRYKSLFQEKTTIKDLYDWIVLRHNYFTPKYGREKIMKAIKNYPELFNLPIKDKIDTTATKEFEAKYFEPLWKDITGEDMPDYIKR